LILRQPTKSNRAEKFSEWRKNLGEERKANPLEVSLSTTTG